MTSRFSFPTAYDVHMNHEELVTLSRKTSQKLPAPITTGQNKAHVNAHRPSASIDTQAQQPPPNLKRHHYVFTDPVAFRYLEEDTATVVVERHGRLQGYEVYLVEQWACSRVHPTFLITTFTGDPKHSVVVGVLGVPADESAWSPRLRVYFKAISQFHARQKDTALGILMVTNLSSFPSALSVIPVPAGDIRKHRDDFIVNENLKRLGCSGRSGMSLSAPAGATQAKFHQLYKTSDRIPFYGAVIELVKLCQVALLMFDKLDQEYCDGLLCDVTEKAITDWWTEIGSDYYNVEPTDGILGPTTVATLLGMLMGARNRLNYYGAPVSKDAFDVFGLKRGIAYFQKSQKLERTRRLDRHTLDRLHRSTAKAAAGEGWTVPKSVKSTVVELGGKGGEMVMGMVGGRDKAGIGDIETLDFDQFVSLVHGERSKWLWYGKPRRSGAVDPYGRPDLEKGSLSLNKDDQGSFIWTHNRTDSRLTDDDTESRRREKDSPDTVYSSRPPGSATSMVDGPLDREQQLRRTVFKSVTGKMSDARSGLGRIKDAVVLRGHASRHSKDDGTWIETRFGSPGVSTLLRSSSRPPTSPTINKAFTWKDTPERYQDGIRKEEYADSITDLTRLRESESPRPGSQNGRIANYAPPELIQDNMDADCQWAAQVKEIRRTLIENGPSLPGSVSGAGDIEGAFLAAERDPNSFELLLHRRHSISTANCSTQHPNDARWHRHMSFSDAEEAVLSWEPIDSSGEEDETDTWVALQKQNYLADDFRHLYTQLADIQDSVAPWVGSKVDSVQRLDEQGAHDQEESQTLYYQLGESFNVAKHHAQGVLDEERAHLTNSVKNIDIYGSKLDYEISLLFSKVVDVEDGVAQFERQVLDLESQADELQAQLMSESWPHWIVRSITGIGAGPPGAPKLTSSIITSVPRK